MSEQQNIPIIILNWNGWNVTFECLQSIYATGDSLTVWLVDNASDQDRGPEAQAMCPGLRVLRWEANYGWAGGYNRALRIAAEDGHEFAYLLNNDCTVSRGFLSSAVSVAQSDARIGAVGSKLLDPVGEGQRPLTVNEYGPSVPHEPVHGVEAEPCQPVLGAGMLVRLKAIHEVGCFDERFFCYWEEIDWCMRAIEAGWKISTAPESLVYHRRSSSDRNANATYYMTRNVFLLRGRKFLECNPVDPRTNVYRKLRAANNARRVGHNSEANAIVAGLWDGLTRQFGPRGASPPRAVVFLAPRFWVFPNGFFRGRIQRFGHSFRREVIDPGSKTSHRA